MTAQSHPDYEAERQKLKDTRELMDQQIRELRSQIRLTDDIVDQAVNQVRAQTLRRLEKSVDQPYFGRVRFEPHRRGPAEDVYIGKVGVYDHTSLNPVVSDWRAPVSSLFYSSSGDESWFISDERKITGTVTLKRSYKIDQGQLKDIVDQSSSVLADEFLARELSGKHDAKMRDIVSTIQQEQNEIIRGDRDQAIVVQGVAGSGKTSVALHRLAFLLYQYQDTMKPEHVVIVAPNRMFLDYIADVLPELGVEGVRQTTLSELLMDMLQGLIRPEQIVIDHDEAPWMSRFKGSLAYQRFIESWIGSIEREYRAQFTHIHYDTTHTIRGITVPVSLSISSEELEQLYEKTYRSMPILPRLTAVQKHIESLILSGVIDTCRNRKLDISRVELTKLTRETSGFASAQLQNLEIDLLGAYRRAVDALQLWTDGTEWGLSPEQLDQFRVEQMHRTRHGTVTVSDLPALVVLSERLFGGVKRRLYDHIVVDEAQDIGPFPLLLLRQMASRQSMTVLGDVAQAIYADRGIEDWSEVLGPVLPDQRTVFYRLERSYRSTMEIMDVANTILRAHPRFGEAIAMVRTGPRPTISVKSTEGECTASVIEAIRLARTEGYGTIAIVVRSRAQATLWQTRLERQGFTDLYVPEDQGTRWKAGTLLLPVELAKGLEFDAVIVPDASAKQYGTDELSTKLLYVAVTRALHRLSIYAQDAMTPLLRPLQAQIPS